jgi:hypothetical protein
VTPGGPEADDTAGRVVEGGGTSVRMTAGAEGAGKGATESRRCRETRLTNLRASLCSVLI